jgi:hypothetical protein
LGRFSLRFDAALIPELAGRYTYPAEDRMTDEIGPAAKARGYFSRDEFLALCYWKTPRTQSRVRKNPSALIEEATGVALASPFEALRIGALTRLHGVGKPTASVLLHFGHRERYPILDFRALWSLGVDVEPNYYSLSYWLEYVEACRMLAKTNGVSMRVLDRALWQYSKENQPPRKSGRQPCQRGAAVL